MSMMIPDKSSRQTNDDRPRIAFNRNPIIEARNLYKSFGGVRATQDVSIEVFEGEIVGLIGPNGSGKTTLLNMMAGFYRPDAGQILFRGQNITGLSANQIARLGIIRTWQDPRIVSALWVRQNIEIGGLASGNKGPEQARFVSELIEIFDLVEVEEQKAGLLSYGRQKIVALARSLAAKPEVLMLDEPLAGLSAPEQKQMVRYIREFQRTGSVVIVDHAFGVIMTLCDRVVVLNSGSKLAEGTPAEIASNKSVVEVYLR